MLRKTSASIFLVVMSLLIALHSPVFGYCPESESFFLGGFECQASLVKETPDCQCSHDKEPVPSPCEGEHELISLDSGEYLWSAMGDLDELESSLVASPGVETQSILTFAKEPVTLTALSRPPPPDLLIFRRFSVLRL